MITFNFKDKTVTVNTHSVEGQELYKAQDLLKGYGLEGRKVSDTLTEWKRTEFPIRENPVSVKGGTNQGTYLDKKALLSLATYVSKELFSAVLDAFLALLEGNTQEASNIAGNAAIDMKYAKEVSTRWKEFCARCHMDFRDINSYYGSNITKLVISYSLGVAKSTHIKGLSGDTVVDKLIAQNHGAAILALDTTMKQVTAHLDNPFTAHMKDSREAKKQIYQMLKHFYAVK